jgi:pimeloyl-ACP methyl ester carboxylesterase
MKIISFTIRWLVALIVVASAPGASASASAGAAVNGQQCSEPYTTVTLSDLDPTLYPVYAQLCWRGALAGKTVQILEAGGTYGHSYWDFPYQPSTYSYVQAATDRGYATLNVDHIGTGLSAKPLAELVNVQTHAYVHHQLVQKLHAGGFENTPFNKIIAVGHSLGSGVSVIEAAQYHDVDGIVVTGLMHEMNPVAIAGFATLMHPAQLDPKFANDNLPLGYTTTVPGQRTGFFFNAAMAGPNAIAADEQLKATSSDGELLTLPTILLPNYSLNLTVPVLVTVGQKDFGMCNELAGLTCASSAAVLARERPLYAPATQLESYVQPQAGHAINLHTNAQQGYQAILDWAKRHQL